MTTVETVRGPALGEAGVSRAQITATLVDNPRRFMSTGRMHDGEPT
jgi:predicted metal-dependent phosphotriesterase family hydrolase